MISDVPSETTGRPDMTGFDPPSGEFFVMLKQTKLLGLVIALSIWSFVVLDLIFFRYSMIQINLKYLEGNFWTEGMLIMAYLARPLLLMTGWMLYVKRNQYGPILIPIALTYYLVVDYAIMLPRDNPVTYYLYQCLFVAIVFGTAILLNFRSLQMLFKKQNQ